MTLQVRVDVSRVDAAPGDVVTVPVRLTNAGTNAARCTISIVGLTTNDARRPSYPVVVEPGATVDVLTPVPVPDTLGVGEHAAAIEVVSDRPGDRAVLAPFFVSIASVALVDLTVHPGTLRGRRRASFKVDVVNQEPAPVDLTVSGEAPDVRVRFRKPDVHLASGQRALVSGKVKGPRKWSGESTQHNILLTARGRASATTTTAAYIQRPLFAHRARMLVAAMVAVVLWLGAIAAVALWWTNRNDEVAADREVVARDTDGDGVLDTFVDASGNVITGVDTDGDGVADQFFDQNGNPVPDPTGGRAGELEDQGGGDGGDGDGDDEAAGGPEGPSGPTTSVLRGTVKAPGELSDITITLSPIGPGETADPPTGIRGFVGADPPKASKIWSARIGRQDEPTLNAIRQTEPVAPLVTNPKADGVWQFTDVKLRRSYEIEFAKPGFNTQSFVVTPPEDGSAVDLDVELEPATGQVSGTVFGPAGRLGGAEITVTDGTLTFTTTASTVDDVGAWSVTEVSTPGVYTISAVLRGYGTEVRQVELGAGETFADADLTMVPGAGSISGRIVGPDGQPLGGVSVTAADGEERRTTTSLTDGDIGSFNIPQLDVPGTYTLRVEAPGYLTQTRRVPVAGAVAGADFAMTKTTVRLTGSVTTAGSGKPVVGAGLTLTTGELEFRISTAGGVNAGTFAIDDLPPGNYAVNVQHYQHVTSTQSITLTAGVTPPSLDIALQPGSGIPDLGTGSLVVEVIDPGADTAAGREVQDATVKLVRTRTGEVERTVTQKAFNFRIDEIPVGTYTLFVTAPKYNAAPPRQVSIGLGQEREEVELLRLGQAFGYVVDSISGEKLTGYVVNLYLQPEVTGAAPRHTLAGNSSGLWQTPPDTLEPGVYRVEITDNGSPPGYLVRDQLLDPDMPGIGADRNMKFIVDETDRDPVPVADIQADAYPNITGRVYRPMLTGGTVGFDEFDDGSLKAMIECGGPDVPATMLDVAGTIGGTPAHYESFEITKFTIDSSNLSGACTVHVSADGYATAEIDFPGLDANNGVTLADRRVHVALAPPAPAIGGRIFWRDGAQEVAILAARVTSTRITSFNVLDSDPAVEERIPTTRSTIGEDVVTDGTWDLPGQIWGTAPYLFTADSFADGTIDVTVDDSGASAADGVAADVTERPSGAFDVEMTSPTPRTLEGSVTIHTNNVADFDAIEITATGPTGAEIDEDTTGPTTIERIGIVGNRLDFEIRGARPGSWEVDVDLPPHHAYHDNPAPMSIFVPAGSGDLDDDFDISMVELAAIELTLVDGRDDPITTVPSISLSGGPSITGTLVDGSTNTFRFDDIPVDPVDPVGTPRTYSLALTLPGHDVANALIGGVAIEGGATAVPIDVAAGLMTPLGLEVPKFGTIAGVVEGDVGFGDIENIAIHDDDDDADDDEDDDAQGTITVTAVDVLGDPVDTSLPGYVAPTLTVVGNTYSISGPEGYYLVEVAHPEFHPDPAPPTDAFVDPLVDPIVDPPASIEPGVLRIVNDESNRPEAFDLPIIKGSLGVTVVESLNADPVVAVPGAQYTLFRDSVEVAAGSLGDGLDELIADIYPGDYRLELRRFTTVAPIRQDVFPVITNIRIERAVAGVPSTATVRAPLLPVQPVVAGTIRGVNQDDNPVALPAAAAVDYVVTSTYDEPAIEINGTTTVPDPNQASRLATILDASAPAGTISYRFADVPIGMHQVTLAQSTVDALTGYTLRGTRVRPMSVTESDTPPGPEYLFEVEDVEFRISVTAGDYPEITTMRLTSPAGIVYGIDPDVTHSSVSFDEDEHEIVFSAVAPEIGNFKLDFDDVLHESLTGADVQVAPDLDGDDDFVATDSVETTSLLGRVFGTASQRDTSDSTSALGEGATITLTGGTGPCAAPNSTCVITVAAGAAIVDYQFDVAPGTYQLETERGADYTSDSHEVVVTRGATTEQNVQILKLATFTVTVTNPTIPGGTSVVLLDDAGSIYNGTQNASVWTFKMVPGGNYRIRGSAPGYANAFNPTSGFINAGIGAPYDRNITLVPRTFTVTVNGGSPPTGTTVTAVFGPTRIVDSTAPFTFSSATNAQIPVDGAGFVVVDAPGYRAADATIQNIPAQTINVTILTEATLTGSIDVPDGEDVVSAVSGSTTFTADVVDGEYTISGLDVGADGADREWEISYDQFGIGTGSTTVVVTSSSVTPSPAPIDVDPEEISVTFTVSAATPNGPVTITFAGATRTLTPTVAGVAAAPIIVDEDETDLDYTVSGAGYLLDDVGTVTLSSRDPIPVAVVVTARPPVAGRVENAGGNGIASATLRVCGPATTSMCSSGQAVASGTANGTGAFSIATLIAEGTYRLWARNGGPGGASGFVTLTVDDDRSHVLSSSTIVVS